MSDDEDCMADRRGIKRAHESPQKINSLFEGQALDVGDECSVESDCPDWYEHFKNHPSQQEPEDSEDEATESDDNDFCIGDIFSSRADFDAHACGCQFEQVPNPTYRGTDDEFKLNKLWFTYGMTHPKMLLKTFTKEMLAIVGKRANRQSKGIFMDSGSNYLQGYEFKSKEPAQNHGPVMAQAVAF